MIESVKQIKLLLLNNTFRAIRLLVLLLLFKCNCIGQNLVQNCSFERTTNINCTTGPILNVDFWQIISSPDYFTSICSSTGSGVPANDFGYSPAKHGNAYTGIGTIGFPYERKELLIQHLNNSLIAGKTYYVSFFLSKSDRTRIATEKIGAYFSVNQPTVASSTAAFIATPQVENHSGFLTDTANWVEISGYFEAQGGEEYMSIGNFNSNADTDTLHTGTANPFFSDAGTAYYYIDSVSLYDSLTYVSGLQDLQQNIDVKVFPNPNNGHFVIEYNLRKSPGAEMRIFDITGKLITSYKLDQSIGKLAIDDQGLKNGVYYYSILVNDRICKTDKIVIIK